MENESNTSKINQLIKRAAEAEKSDDAMKFSQAALNAANAAAQKKNAQPDA